MKTFAAWLLAILVAVPGFAEPDITATQADPATRLHQLFVREWSLRLAADPLLATAIGEHQHDAELPQVDAAARQRMAGTQRDLLRQLSTIDRLRLSPEDRISYDMFQRELSESIVEVELGTYQIPFTTDTGFHIAFARLPAEMPLDSVVSYDNYIARLLAFPTYVDQHISNMRAGLERGMSQPRVVLDGLVGTFAPHLVETAEQSLFYRPFSHFPNAVPSREHQRLASAGRRAVIEGVVAGYARLLEFFRDEYLPGARQTLGASQLPQGAALYRHQIRHYTTLDLSPEEIHRIGRDEVARIRGEMDQVIAGVGFQGSFAEFLSFLRTDPQFYAKTPEELIRRAAWITKQMDGRLPALFKKLPRQPYGVAPVPDHLAPNYTSARYIGAAPSSRQAGFYWVNTYALESRPLYVLEALSLHEAVPGHHLQISLNQELEDLPAFRRYSYLSAFGEGWGLYAEWLGLEAGFYTDKYSNFGRLTYEMWRACRLVVDTGLHAMGWSREQARDYLAANTALSLHEVGTEIDRYISWPAQALSYKLGELEIRRLRRRAENELGTAFDVRDFHDVVLRNGSVPLNVLGQQVEAYIEALKAGL